MMIHTDEILETAADKAKLAAQYGAVAFGEAVDRLTPLLDSAAKKVVPVADDAWEAAKQAKRRAAGFAAGTIERIQPSVNSALSKVAPAVDHAQQALQEDLLPKLVRVLQQAAATPAGREAREILSRLDERADASMVALKGELAVTRKSSKGKKIATVAVVGAVLGALAIAVRTFLGGREDWAAYEPDEPYVYPDDDYEIDEVIGDTEVTSEAPAEATSKLAEVAESISETVETVTETIADKVKDAVSAVTETVTSVADQAKEAIEDVVTPDEVVPDASAPYGEGSYVGATPPGGFVIKGNERSMKYHLPEASGYARTAADVWFASEEAAQAAGFVRSQR